MNKIIRIEALRGFVALYVMLAHFFHLCPPFQLNRNIDYLTDFGDTGVAIFFVISGFVIQLTYSKGKDKTFRTYFFKRFTRIYVPLIIVFITTYITLINDDANTDFSFIQLIANLLMIQHLHTYSVFWPLFQNGPLWSLAFEWWYYMLFFFLVYYIPRYASTIVYILCLIGTLLNLFFYQAFIPSLLADMSLWWLGVEMAKLYLKKGKIEFTFTELKNPLLVISFSTLVLYINDSEFYIHLFRGLCCIIIGILWCKYKWKFFDKTIGLFLPLGQISYLLYIAHFPLIVQAHYLDKYMNGIGSYIYIVYFAILFAYCYLVEVFLYPRIYKYLKKIFLDRPQKIA